MSPAQAWIVAAHLLPRGLLSETDFTRLRYQVALIISEYDAPPPEWFAKEASGRPPTERTGA